MARNLLQIKRRGAKDAVGTVHTVREKFKSLQHSFSRLSRHAGVRHNMFMALKAAHAWWWTVLR